MFFIRKQVKSFKSTGASFISFHTRTSLCSLLKDFYSSTEVKRAQKLKKKTNPWGLQETWSKRQGSPAQLTQWHFVPQITYVLGNLRHISIQDAGRHTNVWNKGGAGGMGKWKRETICLQYTHFSVHSITHQNANTVVQWVGDVQKLSLQKDREKIRKKLNTSFLISPHVLSVNVRQHHISVLLLILWGCRMCVSSSKFSKEQKCIYMSFCSHPTLLPSYKEADCPFAPVVGYSSSNPCFVLPEHPFAGSQKKKSIPYTHTQFPFPGKWVTCSPPSSPHLYLLLLKEAEHHPPQGAFSKGGLKGWSVRLRLPSLRGVCLLPKALLLPLSEGRGQSLIPQSNRDFQKDFPPSTALVPSYF